ncbi:hypothetical protein KXQ82_02025 [Mucilaginibacter sp. HMF5004]|uniref:hypothetical protein n=1 Tax=Mucilaginibacter rivuli TaxID=2857527 RepID=UPI001C5CF391|nr:hypothetical protein [Mucilaginibacter rivuli]MBW4888468.1 hypothetical protein [Mucilaginibacter rivuli]
MLFRYLTIPKLGTVFLLVLLLSQNVFGQQPNQPAVLPPSPQAHALIQYNSPEIGLNTGTLQLSIPLFELKDHDFSMPISLKYATNGVKVDEAASRVGMSWVLNSGGVIIRSVNGRPDELSTRIHPPNDGTALDQSMLTYLQNVTQIATYDSDPDEFYFNFNGYSGKFILDSNMHPVCIPYMGLKIDYSGGTTPTIAITTPDGTVYSFQDIEQSTIVPFCYGDSNPIQGSPIPTAWYLSSAINKDGNGCNFHYEDVNLQHITGVTQTTQRSDDLWNLINGGDHIGESTSCQTNQTSFCTSYVYLSTKRIASISCGSATVNFYYKGRQDLLDDKLVDSVTLKTGAKLIDRYKFDYTTATASTAYENPQLLIDTTLVHRPFLTGIHHLGGSNGPDQVYHLTYNDIQALPQRSSFAQDYFGYANGKHNFNFLPIQTDSLMAHIFPSNATASADRSIDSAYAAKGVLKTIQYPSGGLDNFYYKGNDYPTRDTIPPGKTTLGNNQTSGSTVPVSRNSANFQILYNYPPFLKLFAGTLILADGDGNTSVDPDADLVNVQIIRTSDNASMFSQTLKAGQQINQNITGLSLSTNYYLHIEVLYPNIKATSNITYPNGDAVVSNVNKPTGGVRIDKIVTSDGLGHNTIKKYYYSNIDSLSVSSGVKPKDPIFIRMMDYIYRTGIQLYFCRKYTLSSNTCYPLYQYGQSTIQYGTVTESLGGDSFEGGGIMHQFNYQRDGLTKTLIAATFNLGFKYSNTGYLNGYEKETNYYKHSGDILSKVKQVFNYYSVNSIVGTTIPAYIANRYFDGPDHYSPPIWMEFAGYELYKYTQNSRWVMLDSTKTLDYQTGTTPIISTVKRSYDNIYNLLPTQVSKLTSKQENLVSVTRYPHEMVAAAHDPQGTYQDMIDNHIYTIPIEESVTLNSSPISLKRTNYNKPGGKFKPDSIEYQTNSNPVQTYTIFNSYDAFGNVTSLKNHGGPTTSYQWGYNHEYPVAECKNASNTEFYYEGFEESTASGVTTGTAHTGRKYSTSASVSWTLPNSRTYVISYWYLSGGAWLFSGEQAFTGSFTMQTASGYDDIRIHPTDAQMTTYTYDLLVGMTSAIGGKGQTTYYEYDSFQRLINVKDQDGKILKHTDYHYQNQ